MRQRYISLYAATKRNRETFWFSGFLLCLLLAFSEALLWPQAGNGTNLYPELVEHGAYIVGPKKNQRSYNENELLTPASTLKIVTSLLAIKTLGEDFRFTTCFYLDKQNNLYIKGYGDPFLTSEIILRICQKLHEKGLTKIRTLYLDDFSYLPDKSQITTGNSHNPYDAPNGALCVNFNSLAIYKNNNGQADSAEKQTPLLPIMKQAARLLPKGRKRININSIPGIANPVRQYAGELWLAQLQYAGIETDHLFAGKKTPKNQPPFYIYRGERTLLEIVSSCLLYSNNFIANQLFLRSGAKVFGFPATWEKSRRLAARYLREELNLTENEIRLYEGSGLSRKNRASAKSLYTVLGKYIPYRATLPKKHGILVKSGTLTGSYCYAGYLQPAQTPQPFVILLNQDRNTRDALLKKFIADFQ